LTPVTVTNPILGSFSFWIASAKAGSRAALRSATPHLRRELGRQIRLKVVPELRFEEDETLATGERIDRILDQLHHDEGASHDA